MRLTREIKIEINAILERLKVIEELNQDTLPRKIGDQIILELKKFKARIEHIFYENDVKEEKIGLIFKLLLVEHISQRFQNLEVSKDEWDGVEWDVHNISDEYDRYNLMGLEIDPTNVLFNFNHGSYLR